MPLAEGQHPVGDLRPDGQHEPFRISIRVEAPRRDPHGLDASFSQDLVERLGELPGPVTDQEPEVHSAVPQIQARSPRSISSLRVCCTVYGPSGFVVIPRTCTQRLPTSMTNRQYRRWRVTAQCTWKKPVASSRCLACRNCRQVVSVRRSGAGGIFRAMRIRRIVEALTR